MMQDHELSPQRDRGGRTALHAHLGSHGSRRPIWWVELSAKADAGKANEGLAALLDYSGMLDPRDRKHNGRWHGSPGSIDLVRPLPLPGQ